MDLDRDDTIKTLNEIVELELAGAVRYTQYSLMTGPRIWWRGTATV